MKSAIIQSKIAALMKSSGCSYQDAWNSVGHDHPELFDGAHRAPANRAAGVVSTVMNTLGQKQQQQSGKPGAVEKGKVYPTGFAGGPQVNALRAAGSKI